MKTKKPSKEQINQNLELLITAFADLCYPNWRVLSKNEIDNIGIPTDFCVIFNHYKRSPWAILKKYVVKSGKKGSKFYASSSGSSFFN